MAVTLVENNPTFFRDTVANILFKTMDGVPIYSFDPFNPTGIEHQPIYYQLQRSARHHGIFEIQIEDENYNIDRETFGRINQFEISIGKTESSMHPYLRGFVRGFGHHAGYKSKVLYNMFGYGRGQRFNERTMDYNKGPPKLLLNSLEIDQTDANYFAYQHMENVLEDHNVYPSDVDSGQDEGHNGYGWVNADGLESRSLESFFVPQIVIRFGTIQDVVTLLEQYTGARAWMDMNDDLQFKPYLISPSGNQGFIFKDLKELLIDDADRTGYLTSGIFDLEKSYALEAGFSNHYYGIINADTIPPANDAVGLSNFESNWANEIAIPFRPPAMPDFDVYIGIAPVDGNADGHVPRTRLRIAHDANPLGKYPSTIVNTNGIIDSDYLYEGGYNYTDGNVEVIFGMHNESLDTNKWYWLIMASVGATATDFWRWARDTGNSATRAMAANGTTTDTNGGAAWTYSNLSPQMSVYMIRQKSRGHGYADDKSVKKHKQLIDTQFNLPINVNTVLGAAHYLTSIGRYKSRPRPIYSMVIRPPNKPIFESDVCTIKHSQLNLSSLINSGSLVNQRTPAIFGNIGDVTYTAGVKNAGSNDPIQLGMKKIALTVMGNQFRY